MMMVSSQAQLRLLDHWQRSTLSPPRGQAHPQNVSPVAALKGPRRGGHDAFPQKQGVPRRPGGHLFKPPKPQQVDSAGIFAACQAAARQLLNEGGLTHALAEMKGHSVLGRNGKFAQIALLAELQRTLWREKIPLDQFEAVLNSALKEGLPVSRELLVLGFLSYHRNSSSAAAFKLLQNLRETQGVELNYKDYTELCSACERAADPVSTSRLINMASAQGLRPQPYWYTSLISAHAKLGDVKGAKKAVQEMHAAGWPDHVYTQRALLWAYVRSGRFTEAKAKLERTSLATGLEEDDFASPLAMYSVMGDLAKMESVLAKALQSLPKVTKLWWWAALACARAGRPTDVERISEEAAARGVELQRSPTLLFEAHATAENLQVMEAILQGVSEQEMCHNTIYCHLMVDALGKAGEHGKALGYVELMRRRNSKGLLRSLAYYSHWLSAWGHGDAAEAALLNAPMGAKDQWSDRPRLTADLCSSTCMACWALRASSEASPSEQNKLERLVELAADFAVKGAAAQHWHRYFDLDLSTDLAWPAQLRLLAWLQGLLSTARSGALILEYKLEARFLTKEFRVRREGILAPEDTRTALLGLLHNLGITAAVSSADQRLVVVQTTDLKLAVGDRLRRRASFEAWPNRQLLVKPTRA